MNRTIRRSGVLTFVAGSNLVFGASAGAVALDIKSQPLETALTEFARQSGLQLLYSPDRKFEDSVAPPLRGEYNIAVGLRRLLAESGFTYQFVNDRTIAIQAPSSQFGATESMRSPAGLTLRADDDADVRNDSVSGGSTANKAESRSALPEVLVRGSKSINADIERDRDDIQPYIVISRETIQRSGVNDVGELLRKNLAASTSFTNNSTSGSRAGNTSNVDLRGLGSEQTLILVDGRPAGTYAFEGRVGQPDLNSIPLSSIERIEVLPVSASGIYGGAATGGVVNVVLKRDYAGFDVAASFGNTFEASSADYRVDFAGGFAANQGKTNYVVSGSYRKANPLFSGERSFYERGRDTILANNPGFFTSTSTPPLGSTTNVRSATSGPLTLKDGRPLGSLFAYIPKGYTGFASDSGTALLTTGGAYNLEQAQTAQAEGGANESLFTNSEVKSARLMVRHEFTSHLSAFIEVSGAENEGEFATNLMTGTFRIPQTAPNNPFNQDVFVTIPTLGADGTSRSSLDTLKGVAGVVLELPWRNWRLSADYTYERTILKNELPAGGISGSGTAAITSGTIDVFRDMNLAAVSLRDFVVRSDELTPVRTTLNDAALRLGGALFSLPGGNVDLSFQLEHRRDAYGDFAYNSPSRNFQDIFPARSQRVNSVYSEVRIPIVSQMNAVPLLELLEFQLAGRFDKITLDTANEVIVSSGIAGSVTHAKNSFDSTVPTFGLRIAPIKDLMLRASYGEGFLAPRLTQLVPLPDTVFAGGFPSLRDPLRGNQPIRTQLTFMRGGNPDLLPETSASKSVGLVFTPHIVPGLRMSMDWVRINKKNNIGQLLPIQSLFDNEQLVPGLITRGPVQNDGFSVGPITAINLRYLNLSRATIEAYDWSLDYVVRTDRLGAFRFAGAATQAIHNATQATPVSAFQELATLNFLPRWSANASMEWEWRDITLGWRTQYLGEYWYLPNHSVEPNYGSDKAASVVYHDFSASYSFSDARSVPSLSGTQLTFGITNVFNQQPRLNIGAGSGNMTDQRADPRLSTYYLSVRKSL